MKGSLPDIDAAPSGVYSVPAITYEKGRVLTNRVHALRCYLEGLETYRSDPSFLLEMLKEYPLSAYDRARLKARSLEQLSQETLEEAEKLRLQLDDSEASATAYASANHDALKLKASAARAFSKWQEIQTRWNNELLGFCRSMPERTFTKKRPLTSFMKRLNTLRDLNPLSLEPFIPILFFFPYRYYKEHLEAFARMAYEIDPYQTYTWMMFHVRCFSNALNCQSILQVLHTLYPEDALVQFFTNNPEGEIRNQSTFLSPSLPLGEALISLVSGNLDKAIDQLISMKARFIGFSIVHKCLALAWLLKNDLPKAKNLCNRASLLINSRPNGLPKKMFTAIKMLNETMGSPIKIDIPPDCKESTILKDLISLVGSEFASTELAKFLENCIKTVKENAEVNDLIIVYFGIQLISKRLLPPPKDISTLFIRLTAHTLSIAHEAAKGKLDPWIERNFERKEDPNTHQVHYEWLPNEITWGSTPIQEPPSFEFEGPQLTYASTCSIAVATTKLIHSILLGVLSEYVSSIPKQILRLPDTPTVFIDVLIRGLAHRVPFLGSLRQAQLLLHLYENTNPAERPYEIDPQVLGWAQFAFDIHMCYQKKPPRIKLLHRRLKEHKTNDDLGHLDHAELAAACLDHPLRQQNKFSLPKDGSNVYELFDFSQYVFGWRPGETFNEWGTRLQKIPPSLPFGTINTYFPTHQVSKFLYKLSQFWIHFFQDTVQHNEDILRGKDEKSGDKQREWHQEVDAGLWSKIIRENKPALYPSTVKGNKEKFADLIHQKHEHYLEVKRLRKEAPWEADGVLAVAFLLAAAEQSHQDLKPNIFASSEDQAIRIYQMLLEVCLERLIRHAVVEQGFDKWSVQNGEKIGEWIVETLQQCLGGFHGPEQHLSSGAPMDWHYNAIIVDTKGNLQNVHIYFDRPLSN